jgi:hypothetical protein
LEITTMKMTKTTGGAALALAALFTFGNNAYACNLAGGGGLKSAMLASPSIRAALPKGAVATARPGWWDCGR